MSVMPSFQVVLILGAQGEIEPGELEGSAEVVLEALMHKASSMALGPVMSVDFTENTVELECTVCTTPDKLHEQVGHIVQVILEAA